MDADELRRLLNRDPFEPFRIRLSSGDAYDITDPNSVAVSQRRMFVAHPKSDRVSYIPFLHIAAVDTLSNGHTTRRRKHR